MMTQEQILLYDQICERGIATSEEINLAFNVAGKDWTTLLTEVLYVRTGYRSIAQLVEAEDEEYESEEPGYDLDCGFDPYMGCYTEDC